MVPKSAPSAARGAGMQLIRCACVSNIQPKTNFTSLGVTGVTNYSC